MVWCISNSLLIAPDRLHARAHKLIHITCCILCTSCQEVWRKAAPNSCILCYGKLVLVLSDTISPSRPICSRVVAWYNADYAILFIVCRDLMLNISLLLFIPITYLALCPYIKRVHPCNPFMKVYTHPVIRIDTFISRGTCIDDKYSKPRSIWIKNYNAFITKTTCFTMKPHFQKDDLYKESSKRTMSRLHTAKMISASAGFNCIIVISLSLALFLYPRFFVLTLCCALPLYELPIKAHF